MADNDPRVRFFRVTSYSCATQTVTWDWEQKAGMHLWKALVWVQPTEIPDFDELTSPMGADAWVEVEYEGVGTPNSMHNPAWPGAFSGGAYAYVWLLYTLGSDLHETGSCEGEGEAAKTPPKDAS